MTFMEGELMPKQVELLSELVPQARVLGLLVNRIVRPSSATSKTSRKRRG